MSMIIKIQDYIIILIVYIVYNCPDSRGGHDRLYSPDITASTDSTDISDSPDSPDDPRSPDVFDTFKYLMS